MNISIIGTGAYGQALASMFLEKQNKITMWSKFEKEIEFIKQNQNSNNKINYTTNMQKAIENSDLIVIAIPVSYITETTIEIKKYYTNQNILVASKGIEQHTNKFAINIIKKQIKTKNIGVISGGTFAKDMIKKEPMGLTLATKSNKLKNIVMKTLKNKHLKIQTTKDITGVELCGSVKNIMAIASGIIDGLNYGDSTKFLFITKAIYEIQYLITEFNGNKKTILTYAGIDDIYMTCSSTNSRNYTLGKLIGQNISKEELEDYKSKTTIEGLYTTKSIYDLLNERQINCPLIKIIYNILYKNDSPTKIIDYLEKD